MLFLNLRGNSCLILLALLFVTVIALQLFQQFRFFLQLFLSVFLFLALQALLLGEFLCGFDFLAAGVEEFLAHLLLAFSLFIFKFLVSFLIPLATIGIVSQSCPGHGGGDVLYFLNGDGGDGVMGKLHSYFL